MINKDFFAALEALESEKGIKKEVFINALETALSIAYKKHAGEAKSVECRLLPDSNRIRIIAYQTVVEEVEDKDTQISLEDARLKSKKYKVGDLVSEEINSKEFGRIAAQTAKQVIMQKLREVEGEIAFSELSEKEDQLIKCVVRRIDGRNVYVEINKLEAVLMPQDQGPFDRFAIGESIKVYIKRIKPGQRGPQIIVSRTAAEFVKKLFELEVPEINAGLVEIKSIVREAGYRTKMAVASTDKAVDPVGACVGNRGMRVNSIVSELGGEKIDIIPWCEDNLEFVARSLSPAKVLMVQADEQEKTAKVAVQDEMLSLAIGKDGQNARLAARLTGWKIDVKPQSAFESIEEREPSKGGSKNTDEQIDGLNNTESDDEDGEVILANIPSAQEDDDNTLDDDVFAEGLGELD
ncbi:MAG: transcription termination factor NusA [Firmicutes bacterium]|nr:transcription termination factor NusA [Bacillota bacterium]